MPLNISKPTTENLPDSIEITSQSNALPKVLKRKKRRIIIKRKSRSVFKTVPNPNLIKTAGKYSNPGLENVQVNTPQEKKGVFGRINTGIKSPTDQINQADLDVDLPLEPELEPLPIDKPLQEAIKVFRKNRVSAQRFNSKNNSRESSPFSFQRKSRSRNVSCNSSISVRTFYPSPETALPLPSSAHSTPNKQLQKFYLIEWEQKLVKKEEMINRERQILNEEKRYFLAAKKRFNKEKTQFFKFKNQESKSLRNANKGQENKEKEIKEPEQTNYSSYQPIDDDNLILSSNDARKTIIRKSQYRFGSTTKNSLVRASLSRHELLRKGIKLGELREESEEDGQRPSQSNQIDEPPAKKKRSSARKSHRRGFSRSRSSSASRSRSKLNSPNDINTENERLSFEIEKAIIESIGNQKSSESNTRRDSGYRPESDHLSSDGSVDDYLLKSNFTLDKSLFNRPNTSKRPQTDHSKAKPEVKLELGTPKSATESSRRLQETKPRSKSKRTVRRSSSETNLEKTLQAPKPDQIAPGPAANQVQKIAVPVVQKNGETVFMFFDPKNVLMMNAPGVQGTPVVANSQPDPIQQPALSALLQLPLSNAGLPQPNLPGPISPSIIPAPSHQTQASFEQMAAMAAQHYQQNQQFFLGRNQSQPTTATNLASQTHFERQVRDTTRNRNLGNSHNHGVQFDLRENTWRRNTKTLW